MNLVEETYKTTGHLEIQYFVKTDVGLVRVKNEDNFIVGPFLSSTSEWTVPTESFQLDEQGSVFIVADGMGGAVAGQIASTIAVESIKSSLINELSSEDSEVEIGQILNKALKVANKDILEYADDHLECAGMGTTATICYIRNNRLFISWIGDSRVYRYSVNGRITSNSYNEGYLEILTDDHSLVWNDVLNGSKSPEEARVANNSNVITQSLGDVFSTIKPDHRIYDLYEGDLILNCSDGLNSMLSDKKIENVFKENLNDPKIISEELIAKSLDAGGKDNITIILMKIVNGPAYSSADNLRTKEFSLQEPAKIKEDLIVKSRSGKKWLDRLNLFLIALAFFGSLHILWLERENINNYLINKVYPLFSEQEKSKDEVDTSSKNKKDVDLDNEKSNKSIVSNDVISKKLDEITDSDSDGIIDSIDKCPKIKGLKRLNGCPEIKDKIKSSDTRQNPSNLYKNKSSNNQISKSLSNTTTTSSLKSDEDKVDARVIDKSADNKDFEEKNADTIKNEIAKLTQKDDSLFKKNTTSKINKDTVKSKATPTINYELINTKKNLFISGLEVYLKNVEDILSTHEEINTKDQSTLELESSLLKSRIELLKKRDEMDKKAHDKLIDYVKNSKNLINKTLNKYDLKI